MSKQSLLSRPIAAGLGVLVLTLVCFALEAAPAAAVDCSPTAAPPVASAPVAASKIFGFATEMAVWDTVLGNQTRMIQVGLIVVVIGVFLLSRSIRK